MNDAPKTSRTLTLVLLVLFVGSAIDLVAMWLVGQPRFGRTTRVLIALLPIPANLILVALLVRWIRSLDEFLRRVHLEAATIGFLLTGVAVFIYGYLQRAEAVRPLNFGIVWFFMLLFYGIGYLVASRSYR